MIIKKIQKNKHNWCGGKKGSVLIMTLVIFGIIVVTALSVALTTLRHMKTSMQASKTNIAYQNADEGVDRVMTAILKSQKTYNAATPAVIAVSGVTRTCSPTITSSCIVGATCCAGGTFYAGKIVSTDCANNAKNEFIISLLNTTSEITDGCNSTSDISTIAQLRSIGNDNSVGTQRIVEANVSQKDAKIKLLLHMDMATGSQTSVPDNSRVHHTVSAGSSVTISSVAPLPLYISPNYSYAVFDGSSDFLQSSDIPDDWKLGTGSFTVDFWVNFQDDSGIGTQTLFQLYNGSNVLRLDYTKGTHAIGIVLFGGATCTSSWPGVFNNNSWHHFALVKEETTGNIKLYIDGVNNPISSCSNNSSNANLSGITIGKAGLGGTNLFKGSIDEFRFFSAEAFPSDFSAVCPAKPVPPAATCISY
jgi:hypothetical protein